MWEQQQKQNKSFTRERDCACEQRRAHERAMTTATMATTATSPRPNWRWLAHGCKTSTSLVLLVIVTATMQLAYLNKSPLLVVPIVVTTNSTRTIAQTSPTTESKTALRVVPSIARSTASEHQDVALDDNSHTDAVSATTTTSRENNDNREAAAAATVAANRASELSSSTTAAPTESDLPLSPTLATTDYLVTNLNDASDYVHYQQLSDFLEGPGVDDNDDDDDRDASAAICEFRAVPWSNHFPHA
jgi:hypothetical protein